MDYNTEVKDLANLIAEDIENILDHNVNIHHPNGVFEAKVVRVNKRNKREGVPGREVPFSIVFECEENVHPVQASVMIQHKDFALENVLVTPVLKSEEDKDKPNVYYQAVFG